MIKFFEVLSDTHGPWLLYIYNKLSALQELCQSKALFSFINVCVCNMLDWKAVSLHKMREREEKVQIEKGKRWRYQKRQRDREKKDPDRERERKKTYNIWVTFLHCCFIPSYLLTYPSFISHKKNSQQTPITQFFPNLENVFVGAKMLYASV